VSVAPAPSPHPDVEDAAAAHGRHRREGAKNEAIVGLDGGVAVEPHDRRRLRARNGLSALQRRQPGDVLRRPVMDAHAFVSAQRPRARQQPDPGVELPRRSRRCARAHEPLAAGDRLPLHAAQVHTGAPPARASVPRSCT